MLFPGKLAYVIADASMWSTSGPIMDVDQKSLGLIDRGSTVLIVSVDDEMSVLDIRVLVLDPALVRLGWIAGYKLKEITLDEHAMANTQ